jgi:uracil-DNA glycosylase family 4
MNSELQPLTKNLVPNNFPRYSNQAYRIAFIGEAPGADEEYEGRPFVGYSGRLLWAEAAKVGILRDACFVGNVCQIRPPGNKIEAFDWKGNEIQSGLHQLFLDLQQFKPNLCVLLGNSPLRAFTGESGITNWRGSLFNGSLNFVRFKCLATLHPAGILREYSGKPLLAFDLRRAKQEGMSAELILPERQLTIGLSVEEIYERLDSIQANKTTISIDIEGYVDGMTCISVAVSPQESFIIPFTNHWDEAAETQILRRLAEVLSDPTVPKILQNSLYDTFVLQYGYNIPVRGVVDDTMLMHWELFCEMKKSLAFQASIYTREPYWKEERDDEDQDTRWRYCCKDSAVTYEIRNTLLQQLKGRQLEHYRLNMQLLEPTLYQEIKGINYDSKKAQEKLTDLRTKINRLQWALNEIAGMPHPHCIAAWVDVCRDVFCFKRDASFVNLTSDIISHAKNTCLHLAVEAERLLQEPLNLANHGRLSVLTDHCLNVESKNQIADFLYRQLGLPIQNKKEHGRRTEKETTDVLALLTLYGKTTDPTLKLILKIRALRTRCESLEAKTDGDGRIRCGYNLVGTKTGRLSCYESPTGSGFNLQTATKKDRDLFLPDDGFWMFQCDLSGADGWTVAAHCKACGDPTMLDDYLYGLKPAKILSLISMHGRQVNSWPRERIKEESKGINQDEWMYFARKRIQHGTNYGMKEATMSDQILKDSYKLFGEPVYVSPSKCLIEAGVYLTRYPGIHLWHRWIKTQLKTKGYLTSASGHRRDFFGRRDDHKTFMEACAEEPQNNTTYATKLAVNALWEDTENYVWPLQGTNQRPTLRVAPLHTVHDALIGQFRKEDVSFATAKIRHWFNNPLEIAGQKIVIPFEGNYGESWGNLKSGII